VLLLKNIPKSKNHIPKEDASVPIFLSEEITKMKYSEFIEELFLAKNVDYWMMALGPDALAKVASSTICK
jgi:hypothetical protein